MKHGLAAAAFALILSSCAQATEEDRRLLVGFWQPEDGSSHTVEFKTDGEFNFNYDAGYVLSVKWELGGKGRVDIKDHGGALYKTCHYKIEASRLSIDDGSGKECLRSATTPTTLMPKAFRRP